MAFWKKSDDPWDRKPQRKTETAWREQEPVGAGHPAGPEPDSVGASVPTGPSGSSNAAEVCPWCGGTMLLGHLYSGRDTALWKEGERQGLLDSLFAEESPRQMRLNEFKPSWYCERCEKLVLTASGLELPIAQQKNSFHEYVDQWKAMEEREKQRKKKEE